MKKPGVNVQIFCNGIHFVCRNERGLPISLPEEAIAKARDIIAQHIHTMAYEIKAEIESSTERFAPDFYPVLPN